MRDAEPPRAGTLSGRLYRRLLVAYPDRFRREYGREMAQIFDDLCREAAQRRGRLGLALIWGHTLQDLASSAVQEHLEEMTAIVSRTQTAVSIVGSGFLLISSLFATINILRYEIGIPVPWDPFDPLYRAARAASLHILLDGIILFGPVIALGAFALPLLEFRAGAERSGLGGVVIQKAGRGRLALIGLSLLVVTVFAVYLIGENLPCILGQQVSC